MPGSSCKDCSRPQGTHEIYCCGSRARISRRGVEILTRPAVEYCPLHETLYGTAHIDEKAVRESIEKKIAGHGFCCRNRTFDAEPVVAYGASEMLQVWLETGRIDCAVVVCEGAGTVITANGRLVQAIGARLSGIVKTSPIKEIIERIRTEGGIIIDQDCAEIDQEEGVRRAFRLGFKRIAVSVAGFQAHAIADIRRFETDECVDVLVFSVCNTCIRNADVTHLAKADVVCASASKIVRSRIGNRALLQLGVTIPVYALTERGKELVLSYLEQSKCKLVAFRTRKLPYDAKEVGPKLRS